ncbi:MAG: tRNA 2-thiouridine(34) synthase MnmA [Candidatus Delongbacteria bacterium]|nr:tRNA 2-thiouridine(34) synthase MnmA [Candidatus Delongbacteria bacterium]MBN2836573.1 tRNA 2-thiouridine(34) synthase MnmA [Candidatus Delongbacteria bacterium]
MSERVLVGMSGGVDSSVSAYLLKEQGYDVIGVTMNLWSFEEYGGEMVGEKGCCSMDAFSDARAVARQIGIPHYVINFRDEFRRAVVENFKKEYMLGRTPNPCVLCNTKVKWIDLLKKATDLGCKYIATGHYANIRFNNETSMYELLRGEDPKKDQSYFLYGITQDALSKTIFPLSKISKDKVREIASKLGLKTAQKKESQEICFIPDNDYRRFLKENIDDFDKLIKPGKMYDSNGNDLKRKHDGFPFYTVGQRKGLGGGFSEPMYVKAVDPLNNSVIIGKKDDLSKREVYVSELNWISGSPDQNEHYSAKIRFNTTDKPCKIRFEENKMIIVFDEEVFAVAPGQSAVIYKDELVVGGGIIDG